MNSKDYIDRRLMHLYRLSDKHAPKMDDAPSMDDPSKMDDAPSIYDTRQMMPRQRPFERLLRPRILSWET